MTAAYLLINQHSGINELYTLSLHAALPIWRAAARRSVHADAGSQNLPFFAPSLLPLLIRGGQSHRDQTPDCLGRRCKALHPSLTLKHSVSCALSHKPLSNETLPRIAAVTAE